MFSFANAICGGVGVYLLCGPVSVHYGLSMAVLLGSVCAILASVFDGLDGAVARWLDQESEVGRRLDAGCDIVSFVVLPIVASVCVFMVAARLWRGWVDPFNWLFISALVLYLMSGVARLIRASVGRPQADQRYFIGLPVPAAANLVMVAALFIALRCDPVYVASVSVAHALPMVTDRGLILLLDATLLLTSAFMALPIRIPHPVRWLQDTQHAAQR
ncbi:CDP-alcohol phosphatidyltransferase family protein [Stratiformator vulcanicus]|nr:CDP-alcohol phosphatidyltransferase family protein [Stratiformator vulcanicus]